MSDHSDPPDANLALSILRKVTGPGLLVKFDRGGGHFTVASDWLNVDADELDLLCRLAAEAGS